MPRAPKPFRHRLPGERPDEGTVHEHECDLHHSQSLTMMLAQVLSLG
jgi:hypothetical protein